MCIIALAIRTRREWPLIVAANRDERHDRPTEPLAVWPSGMIGGRDGVAGGTWLGVHPAGRFAALTNIRHDAVPDPAAPSRGGLVADFLTAAATPDPADLTGYNPLNLILRDAAGAALVSNRPTPRRIALRPGLHLVGNAAVGEDAARSRALRAALAERLAADPAPAALLDLLADGQSADTIGEDAIFLRDPDYGTRCSTVVAVAGDGRGTIVERRYDRDARVTGETAIAFRWPPFAKDPPPSS